MTSVLPDVDVDVLGRLLRDAEARVHRKGWDLPAGGMHVFLLYDARDAHTDATARRLMGANPNCGPAVRHGPYAAQVMYHPLLVAGVQADVLRRHAVAPAPWEVLRRLAVRVAYGGDEDTATMRQVWCMPGVIGAAACHEAWGRHPDTADQLYEIASPGPDGQAPSIADLPDAFEMRALVAIDAHDRCHLVTRARGAKPQVELCSPLRGDMSTSLRILVDRVFGRTPADNDVDFEARYPTLQRSLELGAAERDAYGPERP